VIVTWFRADEITAGGCFVLAFSSPRVAEVTANLPAITPFIVPTRLAPTIADNEPTERQSAAIA
jgi:hypothetical protein